MSTMVRSLRKHTFIWLALVLVPLALSACASKKDGMSADMKAINALHQQDMEASKKWDVDTLASLWADDIVTLSQGEPPLIGGRGAVIFKSPITSCPSTRSKSPGIGHSSGALTREQ